MTFESKIASKVLENDVSTHNKLLISNAPTPLECTFDCALCTPRANLPVTSGDALSLLLSLNGNFDCCNCLVLVLLRWGVCLSIMRVDGNGGGATPLSLIPLLAGIVFQAIRASRQKHLHRKSRETGDSVFSYSNVYRRFYRAMN